jgi:hypothetical protein
MPDHGDPNVQRQRWFGKFVSPWIAAPIFLLLLPLLLLRAMIHLAASIALHLVVWARHSSWVIFVYSDSPRWNSHAETHIIPILPAGSVVVNRSAPWSKRSLAGRASLHFGGDHNYCPIGIVFRRWHWVQCFRLHRPFQAAMRDDTSSLTAVQASFVAALERGRQLIVQADIWAAPSMVPFLYHAGRGPNAA